MTWDGIVTKMYKVYIKALMITPVIEAYMQYIVIKKTMESISFDYRRGVEEDTVEQIPKLCNEVELDEESVETKVEEEDKRKLSYKKCISMINKFIEGLVGTYSLFSTSPGLSWFTSSLFLGSLSNFTLTSWSFSSLRLWSREILSSVFLITKDCIYASMLLLIPSSLR